MNRSFYRMLLALYFAIFAAMPGCTGQESVSLNRAAVHSGLTGNWTLQVSPSGDTIALNFNGGVVFADKSGEVTLVEQFAREAQFQGFIDNDNYIAIMGNGAILKIDIAAGTSEITQPIDDSNLDNYRLVTGATVRNYKINESFLPALIYKYSNGDVSGQYAGWNITDQSPGPELKTTLPIGLSFTIDNQLAAWVEPLDQIGFTLKYMDFISGEIKALPISSAFTAIKVQMRPLSNGSKFIVIEGDMLPQHVMQFEKSPLGGTGVRLTRIDHPGSSHRSITPIGGTDYLGAINRFPPFETASPAGSAPKLLSNFVEALPIDITALSEVHVNIESGEIFARALRNNGEYDLILWNGETITLHNVSTISISASRIVWDQLITDNVSIPYWKFEPTQPSIGTLIHIHGGPPLSSNETDDRLVAPWLKLGFTVIMPEFRGSTGYGQHYTNLLYDGGLMNLGPDVRTFIDHIAEERPNEILGLSGFSFGGLSVGASLNEATSDVDFIALDAPLTSICNLLAQETATSKKQREFYNSPRNASNRRVFLSYGYAHCEHTIDENDLPYFHPTTLSDDPIAMAMRIAAETIPVWVFQGKDDDVIFAAYNRFLLNTVNHHYCSSFEEVDGLGHQILNAGNERNNALRQFQTCIISASQTERIPATALSGETALEASNPLP